MIKFNFVISGRLVAFLANLTISANYF